jgi:hypothetical protein
VCSGVKPSRNSLTIISVAPRSRSEAGERPRRAETGGPEAAVHCEFSREARRRAQEEPPAAAGADRNLLHDDFPRQIARCGAVRHAHARHERAEVPFQDALGVRGRAVRRDPGHEELRIDGGVHQERAFAGQPDRPGSSSLAQRTRSSFREAASSS